jgi:hypothetical protein
MFLRNVGSFLTPARPYIPEDRTLRRTCHQNAEQTHTIKVANRSFKNLGKFRYLRTILTKTNLIEEEIKSSINSRNACYYSLQNLLAARLLPNHGNTNINY